MTFKVIRGQGQAEEMTSVPYRDYFLCICTVFALNYVHVCISYRPEICVSTVNFIMNDDADDDDDDCCLRTDEGLFWQLNVFATS